LKNEEGLVTQTAHKIKPFQFDATDCPDLFPPLAALAAFAEGPCEISGTSRLIHKESNRAVAIQSEFAKAGIKVILEGDTMTIIPTAIQACTIDGHGDHRIVMAATILGLFGAPIEIHGAEAIAKSYPEFFDDLVGLGAKISCKNQ
jgi:3-phosphoshikimate 1-carboxyvinyltransferase